MCGQQQILNGGVAYRDVWDHKPPAIYYVDALGLLIRQGSIWGVWFLEFLAIYTAIVLAFVLVKRAFGTLAAIFAVTACIFWLTSILEWEFFITEEFVLPFQFSALYLFYQSERRGIYSWRGFLIGITLAITFMFKPNLIGIQASIILLLAFRLLTRRWYTSLKDLITMFLGTLSAIIVIIIYLFSQDILILFLDQAFKYNFSLYSDLSLQTRLNAIYDGLQSNSTLAIVVLIAWLFAIFYAAHDTTTFLPRSRRSASPLGHPRHDPPWSYPTPAPRHTFLSSFDQDL